MSRPARRLSPQEALEAAAQRFIEVDYRPSIHRYVPLPAQELFHKAQTKHRIAIGGNRAGKTYSTTADDVLTFLRMHPYRQHLYADRPLKFRFIGTDFDRGIEQAALPLFQQFIPPSKLVNGAWEDSYSRSSHVLRLADGSTCSFMSYEQDPNKFQAVWLDHIHFDEEPPQPIFAESMLRLLDSGGTWTLSMTPVQQMEWMEDEIIAPTREGVRTDITIVDLDTRDNVHLSADAIAELGANLTEDEIKLRFEGQYLSKTKVFPEFVRKYPMVIPADGVNLDPRLGWTHYESMDYGYSNPTAWIWTAVHPDGSIVTYDMLYGAGVTVEEWSIRVHAKREELRQRWPGWEPRVTVGDPSIANKGTSNAVSGVTIQQAYAMRGIVIATGGLVKMRSGGNANIGLDKMHTYLRARPSAAGPAASNGELGMPWWQITDNCGDLIGEVATARKPFQTLTQQTRANTSEEIRDKDNHAIDAIKYLFMMTHELRPPQFADREEQFLTPEVREMTNLQAPMLQTHQDAMYATMASTRRFAPSDYDSLEG